MEMKHTRKLNLIGMLGLCIVGCSRKDIPFEFKTFEPHFESVKIFANNYGKGIYRFGDDLDFDDDKINDLYVITKDGSLYVTYSRNLIQGRDNSMEKTWYKKEFGK